MYLAKMRGHRDGMVAAIADVWPQGRIVGRVRLTVDGDIAAQWEEQQHLAHSHRLRLKPWLSVKGPQSSRLDITKLFKSLGPLSASNGCFDFPSWAQKTTYPSCFCRDGNNRSEPEIATFSGEYCFLSHSGHEISLCLSIELKLSMRRLRIGVRPNPPIRSLLLISRAG
jgi:hypothetical protein